MSDLRSSDLPLPKYSVSIRFYAELNDFLGASRRQSDLFFQDIGRRSVKDLIESLGVPHVEVDLILVHGQSVNLDYILKDGDRVSVYPMFERVDIGNVSKMPHAPIRRSIFLVDNNLGKLARNLRLFGFDVLYDAKWNDEDIAKIASEQKRTILTRDRALLKRRIVSHGLFVRCTDPLEQLLEVLRRLDLKSQWAPLSRCLPCGALLRPYPAGEVAATSRIPPCIKATQQHFYQCVSCQKIYWRGRHYEEMVRFVALVDKQLSKPF